MNLPIIFADQTKNETDLGYPFATDADLAQKNKEDFYKLSKRLEELYIAAGQMPAAQGEAFRHIAARDIEKHMRAYLKYAHAERYERDSLAVQQVARAV
jgi:hypothetical protein